MIHYNFSSNSSLYVCPVCRGKLGMNEKEFSCKKCQVIYPIIDGIPDFILEDPTKSTNSLIRWSSNNYNLQAPIYEKTRYPWRLFLYGELNAPSFEEIVHIVSGIVGMNRGLILDVACGPGTLGRRIAPQAKEIYGIDISKGMLRQGIVYTKQSNISNIQFACCQAENMPFQDSQFEAALCGSALHFFADPLTTLCEINRTMRKDAPLVVITLIARNNKKSLFRRFRDWLLHPTGVHFFKVSELEKIMTKAGFKDFDPRVFGSMILFSARKRNMF